jgi:hypothetical protein
LTNDQLLQLALQVVDDNAEQWSTPFHNPATS